MDPLNNGLTSDLQNSEKIVPNDIKLRRQAKNKLKREDHKRVREEELRRKLCEPKDQRVRLVNQNELDLLKKGQQHNTGSRHTSTSFVSSSEEFPSLNKVNTKEKRQYLFHSLVSCQERNPSSSVEAEVLSHEPSTNYEKIKEPLQPSTTLDSQKLACLDNAFSGTVNQHSKPKRNDPIKIDLLTALKKSENVIVPERKIVTKKDTPTRLAGNQLDSSKPERKKGKVREIPKEKKPTHLKQVIVLEREARKIARETGASLTADLNTKQIDSSSEVSNPSVEEINLHLEPCDNLKESKLVTTASDEAEQLQVSDSPLLTNPEELPNSEERCASRDVCPTDTASVSGPSLMDRERSKEVIDRMQDTHYQRESVKMSLHTRKFREYCDHSLSPELDAAVSALVADIVKFQDRLYFKDPIKAHAKRRFVLGLREIKKYLGLKKIKLLIIAPDLERITSKGGIDEIIETMKTEASAQGIPYVFAVGRKGLRKLTNKSHHIQGVSCIGVLSYEGSEHNFHALQDMLPVLRAHYAEILEKAESCSKEPQQVTTGKLEANIVNETISNRQPDDINTQVVASFLSKLVKELSKD